MVQDGASSIYYEYMYMNGILTNGSIYYRKYMMFLCLT